jgi:hypothetical protein
MPTVTDSTPFVLSARGLSNVVKNRGSMQQFLGFFGQPRKAFVPEHLVHNHLCVDLYVTFRMPDGILRRAVQHLVD